VVDSDSSISIAEEIASEVAVRGEGGTSSSRPEAVVGMVGWTRGETAERRDSSGVSVESRWAA